MLFCIVYYSEAFPYLFKGLKWWEDRKIEDMPDYVKSAQIDHVFKVEKYYFNDVGQWCISFKWEIGYNIGDSDWLPIIGLLPATEQEYNGFITGKINTCDINQHKN